MVWLVGIIALIVGFIIGWWWANRSCEAKVAEVEATWKGRLDEANVATESAKADAAAAREETAAAKAEAEEAQDDAKAAED
ncbi:MAG: hypothetical protein KJO84_05610, partial [Acidimicrobiia bacterium]|nr:hypothetical protein [Acidimicrobiia bacterium]